MFFKELHEWSFVVQSYQNVQERQFLFYLSKYIFLQSIIIFFYTYNVNITQKNFSSKQIVLGYHVHFFWWNVSYINRSKTSSHQNYWILIRSKIFWILLIIVVLPPSPALSKFLQTKTTVFLAFNAETIQIGEHDILSHYIWLIFFIQEFFNIHFILQLQPQTFCRYISILTIHELVLTCYCANYC